MFYLIYVSSASGLMAENELTELLHKCRENNAARGITGLLLYKSGNIMQMLEGDEATVNELYQIICNDPRHKNVITIQFGETRERMFGDWSMGFRNMDNDDDLPDYREFIDEKLGFRGFDNQHYKALRFMRLFNNMNR